MEAEARIEHFLNEGWRGSGPKPYTMLEIGECILATRHDINGNRYASADSDAEAYRDAVLSRARLRYKAGYYADPFTANPRKRECL